MLKMRRKDITKLILPGNMFILRETNIPEFMEEVKRLFGPEDILVDKYYKTTKEWELFGSSLKFLNVKQANPKLVEICFNHSSLYLNIDGKPKFAFLGQPGDRKMDQGLYVSDPADATRPFARREEFAYMTKRE